MRAQKSPIIWGRPLNPILQSTPNSASHLLPFSFQLASLRLLLTLSISLLSFQTQSHIVIRHCFTELRIVSLWVKLWHHERKTDFFLSLFPNEYVQLKLQFTSSELFVQIWCLLPYFPDPARECLRCRLHGPAALAMSHPAFRGQSSRKPPWLGKPAISMYRSATQRWARCFTQLSW